MLMVSALGFAALPVVANHSHRASDQSCPTTLPSTTLVSAPPTGSKGPDDITLLAGDGLDGGKAVIWTAFQNGINPNGTPGTTGGPTQSTIAGYDPSTGTLVRSVHVTGKIDGLTADPALGMLIATVNEDANSALNLVDPETGTVTTYTYSPSPEVAGNGGTDSIAVHGYDIYLSHSNPNDLAQATDYEVELVKSTHTALLTPVFFDNSKATDGATGATVHLGLTDPDTNFYMPRAGERFGSTLATIGQGDGQIVFASHPEKVHHLWVLNLTDNKPGNTPPTDGFAVATSSHGTLYVVDNAVGTIQALDTTGCPAGTVFIGEPKNAGNPVVGTLNLWTGHITPFSNSFHSPKGLLFVPTATDDSEE